MRVPPCLVDTAALARLRVEVPVGALLFARAQEAYFTARVALRVAQVILAGVVIRARRQTGLPIDTGFHVAATSAAIVVTATLARTTWCTASVVVRVVVIVVVADFARSNVTARLSVIAPRARRTASVIFHAAIVTVEAAKAARATRLRCICLLACPPSRGTTELVANIGVGAINRNFSATTETATTRIGTGVVVVAATEPSHASLRTRTTLIVGRLGANIGRGTAAVSCAGAIGVNAILRGITAIVVITDFDARALANTHRVRWYAVVAGSTLATRACYTGIPTVV